MSRQFSFLDQALIGADRSLKTLIKGSARAARATPSGRESTADQQQRRHIAGLMRINHTGEVCAQALYQGQALTARSPDVKQAMAQSAVEEVDHLAWCETRLHELGANTSVLNPLFYAASFTIGAVAGAAGDRISLGFVAATEDQVCQHLREHLEEIPADDEKSRAILSQMLEDEADHAGKALAAGGQVFPRPVKRVMTLMSKVMTSTTYRI
ncbi:2-polyprenyl-3-methyl-6-methoxy-1,4-benzoquinone monooxygenase [Spongiibacter taiwanensis]|uniref:2-polyprenyl-3-methyl-6-methoxy-1,4-benzoquinone monooxygenase n=1 Tax=Spongiibacter taiwanensis TaxID=1748242 RepID=UPI0020350CFD|nr:2-polyprenyl-3-methyl-6-methoxy-1,4-benzoquinone monooxygenase [Spongiibacter taiwanensis]USA44175.1 2-polyprenyl-3-methyl-6-methoxy-1,4-benzoquinone monooxygenase [Spongiibacter taiwanensis]